MQKLTQYLKTKIILCEIYRQKMSIRGKKQEEDLLQLCTILKKLDKKDVQKLLKDALVLLKEKETQDRQEKAQVIPVSLFSVLCISSLEAIVLYLRDKKELSFSEMGKMLGRNPIALNRSYHQAKIKHPHSFSVPETKYHLPCRLFLNKKQSVLENIVVHLKEESALSNTTIAKLLNKDPRTIWTVLARAKKKGVKL